MSEALQRFEGLALRACDEMDKFFTYQGENRNYFNRARVAAMVMGSYTRLRATMANERALELATERRRLDIWQEEQRRIGAAK